MIVLVLINYHVGNNNHLNLGSVIPRVHSLAYLS